MILVKGRFMSQKRRTFSREFKLTAVKKVVEQGLSCREVARDLDVRDNLIRNWRKAFEADGTLQAEAGGNPSVDAELKRLREENRQLKMERDILPLAMSIHGSDIFCFSRFTLAWSKYQRVTLKMCFSIFFSEERVVRCEFALRSRSLQASSGPVVLPRVVSRTSSLLADLHVRKPVRWTARFE